MTKAVNQNNEQLQQTLASVERLSETATKQIDSRDEQITQVLNNVQATSDSLAELSRQIQQVTDPDSGTRQDVESTLRDLAAAASSIRRFAETLERNPHALLYGGDGR